MTRAREDEGSPHGSRNADREPRRYGGRGPRAESELARATRALAAASLVALSALGLSACGPSVVRPGASYLRGQVSGRHTWTFNCDPPTHIPPGAPPIDLAQQPVTFQCRSESQGATLMLVLQRTSTRFGRAPSRDLYGSRSGASGQRVVITTQDLEVVLVEATEDGIITTSGAVANLRSFTRSDVGGRFVRGEFVVTGGVNGQGEFELVAR